jgi:hypothetical protein
VGKTQSHGMHISLAEIVADEVGELGADAAHQLHDGSIVNAFDAKLFLDGSSQFKISDGKLLVGILLEDGLLQKLFEILGHLAFDQRRGGGQSVGCVVEFGEIFQANTV